MKSCFCLLTTVLFTGLALAQPSGCDKERSHDFDFWLGTWKVYGGDQYAGTNTIAPLYDGCIVQESWMGANGVGGTSLNHYNPILKQWQQHWVWANGVTITFTGGLQGKDMVLAGKRTTQAGKVVHQRITWTPNEDGTVRQHGEVSNDQGKTWQTSYDLLYKKE